ncbi:hypothetical protein NVP1170O_106 [Vibrio phage 1.170.O._10N.261.52.C3]|nr:hypothetical protein NVP1170O_106 [Vibrio phage 1.170.O._10N.261.52.C3]
MCEYQDQANKFLAETNTTMTVNFTGRVKKDWTGKERDHDSYMITLKRDSKTYTFPFYDSLHNTEKNDKRSIKLRQESITAYAVLACLDSYIESDFDEFCSTFGYEFSTEREMIKVKQIHFDCLNQARQLQAMFNSEELEDLAEIC